MVNLFGSNPFQNQTMVLDREYEVLKESEGRTSNKSSETNRTHLFFFKGCEPQQLQRANENLVVIAISENVMQRTAFKILTEDMTEEIEKDWVVKDLKTMKCYLVVMPYRVNDTYELTVSELDD